MFSTSKCPSCQKTGFEIVTEEPQGSNYKVNIVRCRYCKTAIGAMEYYNLGALLEKIAKRMGFNIHS